MDMWRNKRTDVQATRRPAPRANLNMEHEPFWQAAVYFAYVFCKKATRSLSERSSRA